MEENPEVGVRHTKWSEKEVKWQNKCIWHLVLPSTHCSWTLPSQSNNLPWILNIDFRGNHGTRVLLLHSPYFFLIIFLINFDFKLSATSMPWVIFSKTGLAKICDLWKNILKSQNVLPRITITWKGQCLFKETVQTVPPTGAWFLLPFFSFMEWKY